MSDTPRPRFRFSLRTLFLVMTLTGCFVGWLSYYGRWHQQRQIELIWIKSHRGSGHWLHGVPQPPQLPWSLQLWGDKPVEDIWIAIGTDETREEFIAHAARIRGLFPEAQVRADDEWYGGFISGSSLSPDALVPRKRASADASDEKAGR